MPEGSKAKRARTISRVPLLSSSTDSSLPQVHVTVKQVVKLCRQVSTHTQTEACNVQEGGGEDGGGSKAKREQLQIMCPTHTDISNGRDCLESPLLSPLAYLDFSTQTDSATSSGGPGLSNSFNLNDLATQTDFFNYCTRSAGSQTYMVSDAQQDVEQYLNAPSNQKDMESLLPLPPSAINVYPPPPGALQNLECVGTQTATEDSCYEGGLGMATQTCPDDFYCSLTDDSRIDFGTQTMDWLTDVSSLLPSCYGIEPTVSSHLQDDECDELPSQ